jgi:hypothetical protein
VEVALAVVLLPGVGVGIEQHDAERSVDGGVRAQLAEHDRVVAAERDWRRAGAQHWLELRGDLLRGALRVARGGVQVAEVGDRERGEDVDLLGGIERPQQQRRVADPGGTEARARAHRRGGVEGDAEHGGVDALGRVDQRRAGEGTDARVARRDAGVGG